MSRNRAAGYGFAEGVPIDPVDPGTTLLVAGPSLARTDDLAVSMVVDGAPPGDGMLFVSTNATWGKLVDACDRADPSFDRSLLGVVDCSGQDFDRGQPEVDVKYVSTQSDLTGMGCGSRRCTSRCTGKRPTGASGQG